MARLRALISNWRFYIVIAYFALAAGALAFYQQGRAEQDRQDQLVSQHCGEVENLKRAMVTILLETSAFSIAHDGQEAIERAALYDRLIKRLLLPRPC